MFNSMGNLSTMTTWRCETVQQFSENGYYKAVMLFKVCLHVSGISLMMFDCRAKKAMAIFHQNVIILCRALQVIFTLMHLAFVVQNIIDIIRIFSHYENPCDRLLVALVPSIMRLISGSFVTSITFIYLLIAIERIICTLLRSSYETTAKPKLTLFLVFLLISLSFSINFYFKIYGVDLSTFYVSSVESVIYDGDGYEIFIYVIAGLEVILILLFALIWMWNRQLRQKGRSYQLSLKYQINQTIKVVACFFPVVIAHFLLNVWNLAVSYFIPQIFDHPIYKSIFSEILSNYALNTHLYFTIKYLTLNRKKDFKAAKLRETNDDFYNRQKNMFNKAT